jgi:superfamily II DNA or RNA helicase
MKKAVLSNRIYLSRTKELHDFLIKELTYKIYPKRAGARPEFICDVTRVNSDILTIPAGRSDLIPEDYEIIDKRKFRPVLFPEFRKELRPNQKEIYDSINDNGIILANPGWGKTFTGTAIAAKLGQKTLIITHTIDLRNQWVREIKRSLGIDAASIGGGKINLDSSVVVANTQTLKKYVLEVQDKFGTVIVDECHHLPATIFKTIVDNINSRYKIGLTATLWRKDGKHIVIKDYLGSKLFEAKQENSLNPTVIPFNTGIEINSNALIPWATMINELYDNPAYVELIVNIAEVQAKKGHLVLVVADRVEFLKLCNDILHEKSMLITGATEDRDILNSGKSIVFATTKIFAEGIDVPPLSSLVLASAINNEGLLKQLIGRVCRVHEGKLNPEVIDVVLGGRTGESQYKNRFGFYMRSGYNIKQL